MLSGQDHKRLRQIEITARQKVQNVFAGAYESVYKGRGLTFHSVRPYVYGDDFRAMDWKVSARTGEPYVREYVAEREQTLMIVLDGSASLFFGTDARDKRETAAELAVILATCASINNDRAGLLIYTDRVEHYVPPKRGRPHIMRLLTDIWTFKPAGKATRLDNALRTLINALRSHTIVFLLSDFLLPPASYERELTIAGNKHDISAFYIYDAFEQSMPQVGMIALQDAETHKVSLVDTTSASVSTSLRHQNQQHLADRDRAFKRAGVTLWEMPFAGDTIDSLRLFFHSKQRMQQR